MSLLHKVLEILPFIESHPGIIKSSRPVLWHPDLNLGNLFVSETDPTKITGIIDWQSSQIAPLFLQARVPDFLTPPENFAEGIVAPQLPENFDQLSEAEQKRAKMDKVLATRWKAFEIQTMLQNREAYDALGVDRSLWDLLARFGDAASESTVALRSSLLKVVDNWSKIGLQGSCPIRFTQEELRKHERDAKEEEDRVNLLEILKEEYGTNDEGWVPLGQLESVRLQNRQSMQKYVESVAAEKSMEEALKLWPFPIE